MLFILLECIIRRLTVIISANGSIVRAEIDGGITIKSYLTGVPDISIGLNEDISIGKSKGGYGIQMDDCNFHECVRVEEFETSKCLSFRPPAGEFDLMHYRIATTFNQRLPFAIQVSLENTGVSSTDVIVQLQCGILQKNKTGHALLTIPLPKVGIINWRRRTAFVFFYMVLLNKYVIYIYYTHSTHIY